MEIRIRRLGRDDFVVDAPSLREANLREANLEGAKLRWADLRRADLRWADLRRADLEGAKLPGAILRGAMLREANLRGADLREADLRGAYLREADLEGAKLTPFQLPDGVLIVWKAVAGNIVCLSIPAEARRTATPIGRKCRAEYADVISIEGGRPVTTRGLEYVVGQRVTPDKYDPDIRVECTNGIHFFTTRGEAVVWGG